jgi:hypothetical protein
VPAGRRNRRRAYDFNRCSCRRDVYCAGCAGAGAGVVVVAGGVAGAAAGGVAGAAVGGVVVVVVSPVVGAVEVFVALGQYVAAKATIITTTAKPIAKDHGDLAPREVDGSPGTRFNLLKSFVMITPPVY